jgi:hypothetical protein
MSGENEQTAAETTAPKGFDTVTVEELADMRAAVVKAERKYADAKERAKDCKDSWDEARASFEEAFDNAVAGTTEAHLPFDGVHQSEVEQPAASEDAELLERAAEDLREQGVDAEVGSI